MRWVFGYGSLMWNPGFPYVRRVRARLRGYHRAYAMLSTRNRGSWAQPGLGVSLQRGGECVGVAFEVNPALWPETLAYLLAREDEGSSNRGTVLPAALLDEPGAPLCPVWGYLPNFSAPNFIPGIPFARQVELVARGQGLTGSACAYLEQLCAEVTALGAHEPELARLLAAVLPLHRQIFEIPPTDKTEATGTSEAPSIRCKSAPGGTLPPDSQI